VHFVVCTDQWRVRYFKMYELMTVKRDIFHFVKGLFVFCGFSDRDIRCEI
jgi:hypothetical protein